MSFLATFTIIFCLSTGLPVYAADKSNDLTAVESQPTGKGVPVEGFLDENGRFDLNAVRKSNYQGPLNLDGMQIGIDPFTGAPMVSSKSTMVADPDNIYWNNSISPSMPGVDADISAMTIFQGNLIVRGTLYHGRR